MNNFSKLFCIKKYSGPSTFGPYYLIITMNILIDMIDKYRLGLITMQFLNALCLIVRRAN